MPTCCQRYCIGLIETRSLETIQGCLQVGLGFAHTRRTCLCGINSTATQWYIRTSTGPNGYGGSSCNTIRHYQRISGLLISCGDQQIPDSLADTKNEKKKSESFSLYDSVLQWIQPRHGVNCTLRLHFPCGPTHMR